MRTPRWWDSVVYVAIETLIVSRRASRGLCFVAVVASRLAAVLGIGFMVTRFVGVFVVEPKNEDTNGAAKMLRSGRRG